MNAATPALLPLKNLRILVTRAHAQSASFCQSLIALGAEATAIPVIGIKPPDSWDPLDSALNRLNEYDWLLFASRNAVDAVIARLDILGKSTQVLRQCKLAAVGPATAYALGKHNLPIDFQPSNFIAESLVSEFPGYPHLSGQKMLWPRTNVGRNYLADKLTESGSRVDIVIAYKTALPHHSADNAKQILTLLERKQLDVITLASAQSVKNLQSLLLTALTAKTSNGNDTISDLLYPVKIAAIGPETAGAAKEIFGRVDLEANTHTVEGLIAAIIEHYKPKH